MEKRLASLLVLTFAAALMAGCTATDDAHNEYGRSDLGIIDQPISSISALEGAGNAEQGAGSYHFIAQRGEAGRVADFDRLEAAREAEEERPVSHAETVRNIRDTDFTTNSPILDPLLLDKLDLYVVWKTPLSNVKIKDAWAAKDLLLFDTVDSKTGDYKLYAVNLANGYVRWLHRFVSPLDNRPTYNRGVVWVSSANTVSPLSAEDGAALWKTPVPFSVSSPIYPIGRRQYIGSLEHSVYALSGSDKYPDWDFGTSGIVSVMPMIDEDNTLYVASEDGGVYAYHFATDENKWRVDTKKPIVADFANDDVSLYVGSEDYNLYCITKATGNVAWKFPCQGPVRTPVLTLDDTTVLARGDDSYLFAIDKETGAEIWRDAEAVYPVAKGKYLYVCTNRNTIKALDMKTGEAAWEQSVAPFTVLPSNLATDAITLCTPNGEICVIQEIDGLDLSELALNKAE